MGPTIEWAQWETAIEQDCIGSLTVERKMELEVYQFVCDCYAGKEDTCVRQNSVDCTGLDCVCWAVHVAAAAAAETSSRRGDDRGYVEALEHETRVLEKRVVACRSRVMRVTVFDVTTTTT